MWRQEVFVRISTLPFNGGEGLSTNIYPINSQKLSKFRIPSFDFIHSTSRYLLNGQFSVRLHSLLFTYFKSVQAILLTLLTIMDNSGNLIISCSNLLKIKEILITKFKFLLFRPSSGFHFKILFRSAVPLLRPSPVGAIRCRVSQGIVSQPRRSSPHRPVDWRLWEINYGRPFFDLIYSFKLPETDCCSLLFQWWFQNHLWRARQLGSCRSLDLAAASIRQTIRQHRRALPYVSPRSQQGNQIYWKRIKLLFVT